MNFPNLPREVIRSVVESAYHGTSLTVDECFADCWKHARVLRISFTERPGSLAWLTAVRRAKRIRRHLEAQTGVSWLVVAYRDRLPIRAAVEIIERMAYRFGSEE